MPSIGSRLMKSVTVEPVFCLYTAAFVIIDTTVTNLALQKKCRFNSSREPDLNTPCDDETLGVLFASEVNSSYRLIMFLLTSMFAMTAMAWSDLAGRRRIAVIILPIIGLFFQSLMGCLHSYFWTWDPRNAVLSNIVFEAFSGGIPLMTMATSAYMCDVTDTKTRTMGLGLLSSAKTVGDLVGFGSSGFIFRGVGFFYAFVSCAVVCLITLAVAALFVDDISIEMEKKPHFCQFFNLTKIVDSCKVVYKKSLGRNRIVVTMLFGVFTLVFFTTLGEANVQYLFLRYKFHWNERDYSFYVIYRYVGIILGKVFCSIVLSRIFQIHDGIIGAFSGLWDVVAAFGYLFASENWHLYVVPLFDIFHDCAFTASSAFYSKYYKSEEFGQLHSFSCILLLIIPICYPAYNGIFQKTLNVFPSAYFILSIILDIIVVLLYWQVEIKKYLLPYLSACVNVRRILIMGFFSASYFLSKKFQIQKPVEKEMVPMMTLK